MPKFIGRRDFEFMQIINRELVSDVVDVLVVLYKVEPGLTKTNIYGESTNKVRYSGVTLPCLIKYGDATVASEGFGPDAEQVAEFRFVRRTLEEAKTYPMMGDIIEYNNIFYEIDNVNETQLIGSRPEYATSVVCVTHLTRKSGLSIEPRQV